MEREKQESVIEGKRPTMGSQLEGKGKLT